MEKGRPAKLLFFSIMFSLSLSAASQDCSGVSGKKDNKSKLKLFLA